MSAPLHLKIWNGIGGIARRHSPAYWLTAIAVLAITIWATPFIDARVNLTRERNWVFQNLSQSATNPLAPRNVKAVLIKDDDFWDGDLHHRNPTDRAYLARLIRTLDAADASVIALDFDMRIPTSAGRVRPGDYGAVDPYPPYRAETDALVRAIGDVAQRRKVVLARTIGGPPDGPFVLVDDVFPAYGICVRPRADGAWDNPGTAEFPLTPRARANISCGYIALMDDSRRVAPPAPLRGQATRIDSLSVAVARARDPSAIPDFGERRFYASYIPTSQMNNPHVAVSAHDVLADTDGARAVVQGWPVIVGAAWNLRAKGSGLMVDLHDSPIGPVSGLMIHQNLAEAVLSRRIFPSPSENTLRGLEVLVGASAAVFFALFRRLWARLAAVAAAMAALFLTQWLTLQLFGGFFDAFIPVFGLGLHAVADRMVGEHHPPHEDPAIPSAPPEDFV